VAGVTESGREQQIMEIETIKLAYERWQKADAEWIDRMLELAAVLAEARREYKSNNDFGIWLRHNGIKINKDDQGALIHIGENWLLKVEFGDEAVADAREQIGATNVRSPQNIWRALKNRSLIDKRTDSSKSKKQSKKTTREVQFAPKLLAAIRRKRKEAHDVRINRKWRPETLNKIMLHDLLNAVEQFLEDFINHRKMSLDIIEAVKRDPRAAERSIDYVTQDECGIGKFDA